MPESKKMLSQICSTRGTITQKWSTWQKENSHSKESWWNKNTRKTIVKISGKMKTSEETVMKSPKGSPEKKTKKNRSLFKLRARKFHFLKYSKFFFSFFELWKLLHEIWNFFWSSLFLKQKKSFLLRNYKKFFRVFVSWSIKNAKIVNEQIFIVFFYFFMDFVLLWHKTT